MDFETIIWSDPPNVAYEEQKYDKQSTFYIKTGSLIVGLKDKTQSLLRGDILTVPADTPFYFQIGPCGCNYEIIVN